MGDGVMKRSGPPARRTRLVNKAPLERRTPMKASRPKPAVPAARRKTLADRSGGRCEIGLPECKGEALHAHHRITTKAGGRHGEAKVEHDRLSDLLHACWLCHVLVTSPPPNLPVYDLGLCLREKQIPPQEPTYYRGRRVFLDDNGDVHEYEAHCA